MYNILNMKWYTLNQQSDKYLKIHIYTVFQYVHLKVLHQERSVFLFFLPRVKNNMPKQSGFTLVELMIVIAVLGVLVSLAYPSFEDTIRLNRIQSQTSKLMNALLIARSEAVKTNQATVVCKSANQLDCTTSGEWVQGWIIFRDTNGNSTKDVGELVINVSGSIAQSVFIRAGASFANFVSYRPDGTTGFIGSNLDNQSFKICHKLNTRNSRQLFIDASGRPRVDTKGVAICTM